MDSHPLEALNLLQTQAIRGATVIVNSTALLKAVSDCSKPLSKFMPMAPGNKPPKAIDTEAMTKLSSNCSTRSLRACSAREQLPSKSSISCSSSVHCLKKNLKTTESKRCLLYVEKRCYI